MAIDTFTPNQKFRLISFDSEPWNQKQADNWGVADALFTRYIAIQNMQGAWTNALAVTVGQRYVDTVAGSIFEVLIAHTTSSSLTFAADRAANPTRWQAITTDFRNRGAWASGTIYATNDIVTDANRTGLIIVAHTSVTSYNTGVTAGNITTLIDLSTDLAAASASADAAAASAASVDLPTIVALQYIRGNAGATAYESRTPAQTLTDVGAMTPSSTDTFTNKTFDANATGNSLTNIDVSDLANGTDGELITWDTDTTASTVAAGSSGQILTSNGAGTKPTFKAATLAGLSSGTITVFQQTNAPTGWTKDTDQNDKALRIVSGTPSTGGATAFSSVFASSGTSPAFTLLTADMPAHTHGSTRRSDMASTASSNANNNTGSDVQSSSTGGGTDHAHDKVDLAFMDVIKATKD